MRYKRAARGAVWAATLVLAASACGGGEDTPGGEEGEGTAGAAGQREAATAEPIALDTQAAEATWTESEGRQVPLRISPVSLARGDVADLENIRLDDELAAMVPYYLTFRYTGTGEALPAGADIGEKLAVNTADGRPAERLTLFGGGFSTESPLPSACDQAAPENPAAGQEIEVCEIHMLPEGREPASVAYVDEGSSPAVWPVEGSGTDDGVLPAGESVDSSWLTSDETEVPVRVTPVSVTAGTMADLSDWDVEDEGEIPYYVSVEYRNDGTEDLYPNLQDGVQLRTASGQVATPLSLLDVYGTGFEPCQKRVPDEMVPPDGTVTQCSIHMVAEGDTPGILVFQPRGAQTQPLTWHVPTD